MTGRDQVVHAGVPEGFRWSKAPWGMVLSCADLERVTTHAFTTRELDVRPNNATPNEIWVRLAQHFAVRPAHVIRLRQVHGTDVHRVEGEPAEALVEADIAITDREDVLLVVQAADCVPILLADVERRAVGVVHAGWRGTAAGAARKAVSELRHAYGIPADQLIAAIGPSIGRCCYEVGENVREAFAAGPMSAMAPDRWFARDAAGRLVLDLWRANEEQLAAAGIPSTQIRVASLCTASHPELFPSYRGEGARAGRLLGCIRKSAL